MNLMPNTESIATQSINMDMTTRQMTTDPTQVIPEQMISESSVEANVSAIQTYDEMHGSLLNLKA